MHGPRPGLLPAQPPRVRSLSVQSWPAPDRIAWEAACAPGVRLRIRGGAASHLKAVTRADLARRYGCFLDFLARTGRLESFPHPGALITPGNVEPYVLELQQRVSSVTVYGSICKLRRVARIIAPHQDFGWLAELEADLRYEMRPHSKSNRLVSTQRLITAGLKLMADAETAEKIPKLTRARLFRNGLMIALLACCPVRLKNYIALEIGRSFVQIKNVWWIVLAASETKERRADERPTPAFVNEGINCYLRQYRPILLRRKSSSRALWVSSQFGSDMKYSYGAELIPETTRSTIGVSVSPHLFRTAAASTAATHAAVTPHLASALLHHTRPAVTEEHYNRATTVSAAQAYALITEEYRRR